MYLLLVALSFLSLAGARSVAPWRSRAVPDLEVSKGFNLIVNVTNRSLDLKPPVHRAFVSGLHVGAGLAIASVTRIPSDARVFYQNGTADERKFARTTIITDGGIPTSPFGLTLSADEDTNTYSTVRLDAGLGTKGVAVWQWANKHVTVIPDSWMVCPEQVPYYQNNEVFVIKHAQTTLGRDGSVDYHVPEHCVRVNLVPQCRKLKPVSEGAHASHEYAMDTPCYSRVASVDWVARALI